MELEDVNGHAQQQPFYRDFFLPSGKKSAEVHIFFGKRESALGLNGTVDPKLCAMLAEYPFQIFFTQFFFLLRNVERLAALIQRSVTIISFNTLSLERASFAIAARVDCGFWNITAAGSSLSYPCIF